MTAEHGGGPRHCNRARRAQVELQRSLLEQQNDRLREAGMESRVKEKTDDELRQAIIRNGVIVSGVFAAYPFFLGLWLSRRKVTEEVQHWQ